MKTAGLNLLISDKPATERDSVVESFRSPAVVRSLPCCDGFYPNSLKTQD